MFDSNSPLGQDRRSKADGNYGGPGLKGSRVADAYAAALSVKATLRPGTVRVWVHRGELKSYGYDRRGRLLINLDELKRLIERKASEKASATH